MQRYRLSASGSGAWQPGDEVAAREQLPVLAAEATLLSWDDPAADASALNAGADQRPVPPGGKPPEQSPEPAGSRPTPKG